MDEAMTDSEELEGKVERGWNQMGFSYVINARATLNPGTKRHRATFRFR